MTALPVHEVAGPTRPERRRTPAEASFVAAVDRRIADHVDDRCGVLLDVSPDLEPVASTVRDLVRGGKRLRATFCHWGWLAAGSCDVEAAVRGAAALELFHLAALVHDDVMDHSSTRRGTPTAHERFADHHRAEHLDGDASDFGVGAAMLIGDLCMTWSDELVASADVPPARRDAARAVYDLMRSQVMAGQYLDVLEQARPGVRREASATVLRYKSAKYTVEHPLLLGGALSGAGDDLELACRGYGVPVGEAFQLRDDVLGVFGDPARTGKPVGDDLREGKKTLLVLAAVERADPAQRRLLRRRLGDRSMTDAHVRQLQEVLVDTGALDDVERRIVDLTDRGVAAIHADAVPHAAADGLADLALHIADRTA